MLRHTSALRDYEQLLHFDVWRLDSPDLLTDGDIMHIMFLQKELNFPPGSNYSYSNTNYMLLAQVVSRVSKKSFPDFTMTRLFQPLGMKHTHFRVDHGEMIKNVAYAYIDKDGGFDLCLPNYDTVGATNLFTTVEDLARWEENSYTGRVGGAEVIKQLHQPGKLNDGTLLNYAPGMFVGLGAEESGNAGDAGYRADILRFPDDHFSVVTLCNLGSIDPMELSR
jgi:CubicO group peptidase (beta-lactamase class C family)